MAVALPLYLGAVKDSAVKACRANMQTIANAEMAYKVRNPTHTFTTDLSSSGTLVSDGNLTAIPTCPNGGTYSVVINGDGTITVHCSIASDDDDNGFYPAGHGYTPGVDSQ